MSEVASETPLTQAQDALQALARTLLPEDLAGFRFDATIRRGSLVLPAAIPATRPPLAASTQRDMGALPRVSLATLGEPLHAEASPSSSQPDLALVRPLGEGGMGVVWLAQQHSLHRDVAVKRLKASKSDDGASTGSTALLAEARATGALEHPNIVPVHALGLDAEGSPVLVMKRIEGDSLDALIRHPEHPSWPALEGRHGDRQAAYVEILMQVADALAFAHARGIIHRDVKPENVMVGHFGEVYLVDWGIALRRDKDAEEAPSIVGTPSFMAPEMVRGDASLVDAQTDVYLLGATLHAILVGAPRHAGESLFNVLMAAMSSEPFDYRGEHGELGELANLATHADKAMRPRGALAFRAALADYLRHRASSRLADEAAAQLARVADLAPSPQTTRVLTESRFAFTQALRDWPENARAREGLERTLRAMIEAELAHRSPDSAQALLSELHAPDEALRARVAALRDELAEGRILEERARIEAIETDPVRTARQRVWVVLGLIVLTMLLVALGWSSENSSEGPRAITEILSYDAVLITSVASLLTLFRKQLMVNRMGRQISLALVGVVLAGGISDVLCWLRNAAPSEAGPSSMLAMASVLGGAAIGIDRRFFFSAAAFLLGSFICALWPALTVPVIGGASILALLVVLIDSVRQMRATTT